MSAFFLVIGELYEKFAKIFTGDAISKDNVVFKLHYRVTVTISILFSIVMTMNQVRNIFEQAFTAINLKIWCVFESV